VLAEVVGEFEMLRCPQCQSHRVVKNGRIHNGKQNHRCRACGRQFVENPEKGPISDATKELIKRLLLERMSLEAIARVTGVSTSWLQRFVNELYASQPRTVETPPEPDPPAPSAQLGHSPQRKRRRLTLECDEVWSFVGSKKNKVWIWIALDAQTRRVIAMHFGDRDRAAAQRLWDKLPSEYRRQAKCYTDFWSAYEEVIPPRRHFAVGKESGKTNHVERFNNTLRQRCARLVRKTLSFSKKLRNHIGAIWYFVHHYNLSLL
jgi:insertion element IS1 protein InsB